MNKECYNSQNPKKNSKDLEHKQKFLHKSSESNIDYFNITLTNFKHKEPNKATTLRNDP